MRKDVYGRFVSCLVYVPKERFNTELRQSFQTILSDEFNANEMSFTTHFSDSVLARIHFIARVEPEKPLDIHVKQIRAKTH